MLRQVLENQIGAACNWESLSLHGCFESTFGRVISEPSGPSQTQSLSKQRDAKRRFCHLAVICHAPAFVLGNHDLMDVRMLSACITAVACLS